MWKALASWRPRDIRARIGGIPSWAPAERCSQFLMSRNAQPSSSRNPPVRAPRSPFGATSRAGASGLPRTKPPPSPTPGRTLRPQGSLQALRPTSPQKSPLKRTKPLPEDPPTSPKTPALSIREQIALKRAEAKKAQTQSTVKSPLDDFAGLEDALPTQNAVQDEDMVDLGRWSVKETIERARSSGKLLLYFFAWTRLAVARQEGSLCSNVFTVRSSWFKQSANMKICCVQVPLTLHPVHSLASHLHSLRFTLG